MCTPVALDQRRWALLPCPCVFYMLQNWDKCLLVPGADSVNWAGKKSHDGEHQMHSGMEQEPGMRPLAKTQFFLKITEATGVQVAKQKQKQKQYKVYPHGGILCSRTEVQAQLSARATDHVSTPSRVCINTSRTHKKVITVVIGGEKMGWQQDSYDTLLKLLWLLNDINVSPLTVAWIVSCKKMLQS